MTGFIHDNWILKQFQRLSSHVVRISCGSLLLFILSVTDPGWISLAEGVVTINENQATTVSPPQPPAPSPSPLSDEEILFDSPFLYNLRLGASPPVQVFGAYGGEPVADYVTGSVGADGRLPKKISGFRYQDIVFYYLPVPGAALNTWLADSLKGKAGSVNGSLLIKNRINQEVTAFSFSGAFVRAISFPEADLAPGPHPAPIRVTLTAQQVSRFGGSSGVQLAQSSLLDVPMKGLFRFEIDDTQTGNVLKIESLQFSSRLIPADRGGGYKGAVPHEISTLRLQLAESDAQGFYAWLDMFVLKGQNSDAHERNATIRWLSPQNPSQALFTLELKHLGILSVAYLPSQPGYVLVTLYCEDVVARFP